MSEKTGIEWTESTWNPIAAFRKDTGKRGWFCTKPSAGCKNCYSEAINRRLGNGLSYTEKHRANAELRMVNLEQPSRWRRPRHVFVCSMTDLFHEDVPDEMLDAVWCEMAGNQRHTFQVLTKRPERMLDYVTDATAAYRHIPSNIWLGVSAENQAAADERIPLLLRTPAAIRFVSYEPALGPVDFGEYLRGERWFQREHPMNRWADWIICGGESGPGARPCHAEWIRSVVRQCRAAHVACFVKQTGPRLYFDGGRGWLNMRDLKGGDMAEWPEDIRCREMPR